MRSRINYTIILFFAIIVITATGCYNDKAALLYTGTDKVDCATISAKFGTDVSPLIQSKCATAGCHNAVGAAGGTVLTNYAQISAKAARINQRCVVDKTMPVSGPLLPAEIVILNCWISSGAPNN